MATISDDFLREPASDVTVERIDFERSNLPEYAGMYAAIIDNVLSSDECQTLLHAAESYASGQWERAMINIGDGEQVMDTEYRSCGRIIWDSNDLTSRIWKRVEQHVPEIMRLENVGRITGLGPVRRKEVWTSTRLNERMRFLKYEGGEYFRPHCDGAYETPDGQERSYFTLHLYLNSVRALSDSELFPGKPENRPNAEENNLIGGSTPFFAHNMRDRLDVQPKAGRILIFQHRELVHSGDDVVSGVKYTMRTEILYKRGGTADE